jgi:hypothetical protein
MTIVPPTISFLYDVNFSILTGGEYVAICSMIINGYLIANVVQKRKEIEHSNNCDGED